MGEQGPCPEERSLNSNEHRMTDAERKRIDEQLRTHKKRSAEVIEEEEQEVTKSRTPPIKPPVQPRGTTFTASPKARFKRRKTKA